MKLARISKIATASLVGFCAVSLAADKIGPKWEMSQLAGFVGAFLGSMVAERRKAKARGEASQVEGHTEVEANSARTDA